MDNMALADEVNALEQYSRRNSLLLHGIPESDKDSDEAVVAACNDTLDLNINAKYIGHSHHSANGRKL